MTAPAANDPTLVEARQRISALADQLGTDELAVLEMVAHGIATGRRVYGELNFATDKRDTTRQATEEVRDAVVYLSAQLVRLLHRKAG